MRPAAANAAQRSCAWGFRKGTFTQGTCKERNYPYLGMQDELDFNFRRSGFAARAGRMFEEDFGCRVFNGSRHSSKFRYRCRPAPHFAGVGSFAPVGVDCRKRTGDDGVEHASFGCHRVRQTIGSCKRSERALTTS